MKGWSVVESELRVMLINTRKMLLSRLILIMLKISIIFYYTRKTLCSFLHQKATEKKIKG